MIEFILANWEYVAIVILVIDKVVALSPTKQDDMIWSSVKAGLKVLLPGRFGKAKQ